MKFGPLPGEKMVIYGEGMVHPIFMGSLYMKDVGETQAGADNRFSKAMRLMGFEWLGAKNEKEA